ncbi:MAG: hypothetical protein SFY70_02865 [Bacteroidia bacterium]|nr:hypothetical protein [Bacteroidia bacterium]
MADTPRPQLYGTAWCPKSANLADFLQREFIDLDFHDIEASQEAEFAVRNMNGGEIKFPMLVVGDAVMKNPKIDQLREVLRAKGLLK